MQQKRYRKPQITRIKLDVGESIMTSCFGPGQRGTTQRATYICATASLGDKCRVSVC
jgi:hypothetical protein